MDDDVAAQVNRIVNDCVKPKSTDLVSLKMQLISYIVRHSHSVFNHAYKLGQEGRYDSENERLHNKPTQEQA